MEYTLFYRQSLNTVKLSNITMRTIILLLATGLYGCTNEKLQVTAPVVQALPVMSINKSSETTFLEYPASIEGTVDLEIRPQVGGYLDKIFVNEGQHVTAGQSLFKISELPFREALNTAKANLRAAEAAMLNAQLEVDKLLPLVQNKVVSEVQLRTAKATYQIANANVAQSRAGVAAAQINLGYTLIKAPVSGFVGRLPKKRGSLVSITDPIALTLLSDVHEVRVYFSLSEDDFINFNNKYPAALTAGKLQNLPPVSLILSDNTIYTNLGKIDMIDGQFDKNTGAITLRASFSNASGLLRSGNTGKVRLSLQHENAIVIPQSATVEVQDKVFVFTVSKDNKVMKQPVDLLGTTGNNYLVKDGLRSGDKIVSKGMENLKDGDLIQPQLVKEESLKVAIN